MKLLKKNVCQGPIYRGQPWHVTGYLTVRRQLCTTPFFLKKWLCSPSPLKIPEYAPVHYLFIVSVIKTTIPCKQHQGKKETHRQYYKHVLPYCYKVDTIQM